MITIQLSEEAVDDIREGCWFYESQQNGLGDYFSSCLRGDIEGLKVTAGIHQTLYHDYHRLLSRVFPYAIYYTLSEDQVVIWLLWTVVEIPNGSLNILNNFKIKPELSRRYLKHKWE